MSIEKKLLGTNPVAGGSPDPEGVSFSGNGDYLERSSDLTNNRNPKTFTFSAWVYPTSTDCEILLQDNYARFYISNGAMWVSIKQVGTNTTVLFMSTEGQREGKIPLFTWSHILISCDTAAWKIHFLINDYHFSRTQLTNHTASTSTWQQKGLAFGYQVNTPSIGGSNSDNRISNVFLDYTYRDLQLQANRDLFLTADFTAVEIEDSGLVDKILSNGTSWHDSLKFADGTSGIYTDWGAYAPQLKRTSLSGGSSTTTFTISFFYNGASSSDTVYKTDPSGYGFTMTVGSIYGYNSSNSWPPVLLLSGISNYSDQMNHVLLSVDTSNQSNCHLYINDVQHSFNFNYFNGGSIDMGGGGFQVGPIGGFLSHFYLDYTNRDLTVSSNRRLFSTSGGEPATGQSSLNPIIYMPLTSNYTNLGSGGAFNLTGTAIFDLSPLEPIVYLPMTDASTAHVNKGTGGDYVQNGILDTAGRGPNQNNCVASYFDGTNDYLVNSNVTHTPTNRKITVSFTFNTTNTSGLNYILGDITDYSNSKVQLYLAPTGPSVTLTISDDAGATIVSAKIDNLPKYSGGTHHVVFSLDAGQTTSNWRATYDGEIKSLSSKSMGSVDNIDIAELQIGRSFTTINYAGSIGELYLDTAYIDLSSDNPFWDSDTNRPKPVRQVISETGTTPLIALPLLAPRPGENIGSGGNFSGSFAYPTYNILTGARGGSEFWARSANFDGSSGYLSRTSQLTSTDSKIFSAVFYVNLDVFNIDACVVKIGNPTETFRLGITPQSSTQYKFRVYAATTGGTQVLSQTTSHNTLPNNKKEFMVFISFNAENSDYNLFITPTFASLGGDLSANPSPSITNNSIGFSSAKSYIGNRYDGQYTNGNIGFLYFNTSYIDFSQESNRNLFVDQLGYPKDLTPAIDAGTIASPLIYMKFDDTSALGTNSGTGGNFTVNGTVTAGADVDPNA